MKRLCAQEALATVASTVASRIDLASERARPDSGGGEVLERTVLTRDGVTLAVRDYHPSAATEHTVVMVHGICETQASWDIQIGDLRRTYGEWVRVISYDHRGHGQSGSAKVATYSIGHLALDHCDVLDALGVVGPVTLAGHSMGAMTLLSYLGLPAAERPVNPDGLVLVAGAAGRLCERGVGRLLTAPALDTLAELLERTPHYAAELAVRTAMRPMLEALGRAHTYAGPKRSTLISMGADALARTPATTAAGFLSKFRDFDEYATLPTITAHTAVISAGFDALTPDAHARELVSGISAARRVHVPAAGHLLLRDAPDIVSDTIASIIDACRTGPRDALSTY